MKADRILIAEDDKDISEILTLYLENNGFEVVKASNGKEALKEIEKEEISLVIADIMMPIMNGYDLIKEIRKNNKIPIIILSAKDLEEDKIHGLEIGADVYITKPFKPLEVIAAVKAVLRRCYNYKDENISQSKKIKVGELEFDEEEYVLRKNGEILQLTNTELKILLKMMKEPDKLFTREQLYECISDGYFETDANTIMVHISNIRNKIKDNQLDNQYIKTIRGVGYKIERK